MLLSLLKYASLTTDALTPIIVSDIIKTITSKEVAVDNKLFEEVVGALREDDVDKLADIAQKPELLNRLRQLVEKADSQVDDNMLICPHCGEWFHPERT